MEIKIEISYDIVVNKRNLKDFDIALLKDYLEKQKEDLISHHNAFTEDDLKESIDAFIDDLDYPSVVSKDDLYTYDSYSIEIELLNKEELVEYFSYLIENKD